MRIAVIGAGYVGAVAATCFAETGHDVVLVDVDRRKIEVLLAGQVPFYEPGLGELLRRNVRERRLCFSFDLALAVASRPVVFVAVGTPQDRDGSADVSFVLQAVRDIARALTGPAVIVLKSTVPVGTHREVQAVARGLTEHPVTIVSNPEFLKEGAAVEDFLRPDRVVVGTDDEQARQLMADLYAPFVRTGNPILFMDNFSAEMSKYCANGLLAARISFMNEIARLCDAVGADVELVRRAVGADHRIGKAFLFPGVGFGGSCFPKDVRALLETGRQKGLAMHMAKACAQVNEEQKHLLAERVRARLGDLGGLRLAVWGLAFKPFTDDVREAPALAIIEDLLALGATVRAYDPEAMANARRVLGDRIETAAGAYEACEGAEALLVITEWNEFRQPDWDRLRALLKKPLIFDGRNLYDPHRLRALGFESVTIGRGAVCRHN